MHAVRRWATCVSHSFAREHREHRQDRERANEPAIVRTRTRACRELNSLTEFVTRLCRHTNTYIKRCYCYFGTPIVIIVKSCYKTALDFLSFDFSFDRLCCSHTHTYIWTKTTLLSLAGLPMRVLYMRTHARFLAIIAACFAIRKDAVTGSCFLPSLPSSSLLLCENLQFCVM